MTQYQNEKDFAQAVVGYARAQGWLVGYTYDSRKSEPGEPDLRMVRPPVVILPTPAESAPPNPGFVGLYYSCRPADSMSGR